MLETCPFMLVATLSLHIISLRRRTIVYKERATATHFSSALFLVPYSLISCTPHPYPHVLCGNLMTMNRLASWTIFDPTENKQVTDCPRAQDSNIPSQNRKILSDRSL
jgi:hypothetical protein